MSCFVLICGGWCKDSPRIAIVTQISSILLVVFISFLLLFITIFVELVFSSFFLMISLFIAIFVESLHFFAAFDDC